MLPKKEEKITTVYDAIKMIDAQEIRITSNAYGEILATVKHADEEEVRMPRWFEEFPVKAISPYYFYDKDGRGRVVIGVDIEI